MTLEMTVDAQLPGFALANTPAAMRMLIARQWPDMRSEATLTRVRYRPGQRAILQYAVGASWVTALVYPDAERERVWRKLQTQIEAHPQFAGHAALLPEHGLILQRFPLDWKLRTLTALAESPPDDVRAAITQACGGRELIALTIHPVRYRAGLSATLRYSVLTEQGSCTYFAKVYADDDGGARAMQMLETLRGQHAFRTTRPVAYLPERRALFLEPARGVSFESLMLTDEAAALAAAKRIGRALAQFHQNPTLRFNRARTLADEHADVHRSAGYLAQLSPELQPKLEERARNVCAALREIDLRPTHRDLKVDHLFLDGDAITLIDVDSCAMGDPLLELALLLARIEAAQAQPVALALADAYFAQVPPGWRARLTAAKACAELEVEASFARRRASPAEGG